MKQLLWTITLKVMTLIIIDHQLSFIIDVALYFLISSSLHKMTKQ